MKERLVSLGIWFRDRVWGRPWNVDLFLDYHPHLRPEEARRVLGFVMTEINYRRCARTVPAVAAAIAGHFDNWFFDYNDAARHAAEALGFDIAEHPTETE